MWVPIVLALVVSVSCSGGGEANEARDGSTIPASTIPASSTTASSTATSSTSSSGLDPNGVTKLEPRIIRTFPHSTDSFTQGLELHNGKLFESVGLYGSSGMNRLDPVDGELELSADLDASLFGEGITRVGDRWYQLTWREGAVIVWDDEFNQVHRFEIDGEGWGLCFDGTTLFQSDGSSTIHLLDPDDLSESGSLEVTLEGAPVDMLNELECAESRIWANVWESPTIVGIDPDSGEVEAVIDATSLVESVDVGIPAEDVLNGIAFDEDTGHYFLTGKRWPLVFEVELVAEQGSED